MVRRARLDRELSDRITAAVRRGDLDSDALVAAILPEDREPDPMTRHAVCGQPATFADGENMTRCDHCHGWAWRAL